MREVRWERMFPDELEQAFAACPVVYFAYGLCEPHGPQNAVGLDALKAHAIARAAAHAHGFTLRAARAGARRGPASGLGGWGFTIAI